MGRVIAIGGGVLDTTARINRHAIALTGQENPNLLFISTASRDAKGYIAGITSAFDALGCAVQSLRLVSDVYTEEEVDRLLDWADLIYVGGGDTIFMMETWKRHGLDLKLKEVYRKDRAVLSGLSAGAICWFNCGHSDSESFHNQDNWQFCWANEMLNLIPLAYCPHYNEEGRNSFDEMLKQKHMAGIAMENDTAFVEDNGNQYFIRSHSEAKAFWIQYSNESMEKQEVTFKEL